MNPRFAVLDADVLIQFCRAGDFTAIRVLRDKYGIRALLPIMAENEVRHFRRHGPYGSSLNRIYNKVVFELSAVQIAEHDNSRTKHAAQGIIDGAAADIATFGLRIDAGEAECYAYSNSLGCPLISNDQRAVAVMSAAGHWLPATVIRTFDLVVLAHQVGAMTIAQCEGFRKALLASPPEGLPASFQTQSIADGLNSFRCRLRDSAYAPVSLLSDGRSPGETLLELSALS